MIFLRYVQVFPLNTTPKAPCVHYTVLLKPSSAQRGPHSNNKQQSNERAAPAPQTHSVFFFFFFSLPFSNHQSCSFRCWTCLIPRMKLGSCPLLLLLQMLQVLGSFQRWLKLTARNIFQLAWLTLSCHAEHKDKLSVPFSLIFISVCGSFALFL